MTGLAVGLLAARSETRAFGGLFDDKPSKPAPKPKADPPPAPPAEAPREPEGMPAKPAAPEPAVEPEKPAPPIADVPIAPERPSAQPRPASPAPRASRPQPRPAAPPPPSPVPAKPDHEKAVSLVRQVFADDYAKKTQQDRADLAARLLEQARSGSSSSSEKFALLTEARDVAAGGGDTEQAMNAINQIAQSFAPVDVLAMKMDALNTTSRFATDGATSHALALSSLQMVDDALQAGNLDVANKAATLAETAAKKSGDDALVEQAGTARKNIRQTLTQFSGLAIAQAKLQASPGDPSASLVVGKYFCLLIGNWEAGLPHLAACGDPVLKAVAAKDAAGAASPADREALGDAWAKVAEQQSTLLKDGAKRRAAYWYGQALEGVTGLQRARLEKLIEGLEVKAVAKSTNTPEQTVARMIETILRAAPVANRPKPGTNNPYGLRAWLATQENRFGVSGTLKVAYSTQYLSTARGTSRYLNFAEVGPLQVGGNTYFVTITASENDVPSLKSFPDINSDTDCQVHGPLKLDVSYVEQQANGNFSSIRLYGRLNGAARVSVSPK